jgi:rubrerythrin
MAPSSKKKSDAEAARRRAAAWAREELGMVLPSSSSTTRAVSRSDGDQQAPRSSKTTATTRQKVKQQVEVPQKKKSEKQHDSTKEVEDWPCPICLDTMANPGASLGMMIPCGHWLHKCCFEDVKNIAESKGRPLMCPTCKQGVEKFTRSYICDGLSLKPAATGEKKNPLEESGPISLCGLVELLNTAKSAGYAISIVKEMYKLTSSVGAYENWKENATKLVQAGAMEAVVATMNSYQDKLELQKECLLVVALLFFADNFSEAVMKAEAMPALLRALATANTGVQYCAAWALRNIVIYSDEVRKAFVVQGGVKLLVAAMKASDKTELQQQGCAIIWQLGCNELFWSYLVEEECHSAVAMAVDRHRRDRKTVEYGLKAAEKCILAQKAFLQ